MARGKLKIFTIASDELGSSNNMVELSIIIPSYNTRQLLKDCLDSIYQTTKLPFEIIVVDNASTDGTIEEIGNWKLENGNLELIRNNINLGFAKAINQGLERAQGRYLLILNSDTKILDGTLDKEIFFLKTHTEVGVVGCQLKNRDGTIQPSGGYLPSLLKVFFWMSFLDDLPVLKKIIKPYHVEDKEFYSHQRYLGWVTGAFFLTRREVFEKVRFFDERMFMYVEEVDWCTRVKEAGFRVALDPGASIIHYKGASARQDRAGILEEYQGLKYYFAKHQSFWQTPILRFWLKLGALVRLFLFGIIAKDPQARRIYAKAYRVA